MALVPCFSSSDSNSCKYNVFISFQGEDTRKNITSHLYAALRRSSIETYIDEKSLERGEEISPALLTAIKESLLSLVVFSQNYASSRWCLDELVQILKCKKKNGQIVIPVFYHVDPSDVRHQRGSYGAAFVAHHKLFKHNRNKVEVWRNALKEAVNLSGFDLKDESEAEFVEKIVEDVWEKLKNKSLSVAANGCQDLVGMSKRLHEMESLLRIGSPDVRIIGLWGMGGIGKTTLAEASCERFSYKFRSCFFIDMKEDVGNHGLKSYKEMVFGKFLKRYNVNMEVPFRDVELRRRKVLAVLDNLDSQKQLEDLVGKHSNIAVAVCGQFGVGSRIIITSRDKKLLNDIGADEIYRVKALDDEEARIRLYTKAFRSGSARSGFEELAERVLRYAKGHPLALEILGSYLYGRSKEEWKSTLSKLKKFPDKRIHDVFKLSFDALDCIEKSIFLDISCFFNLRRRDFIESIYGDEAHIGISVLIERSLIIEQEKRIRMHGLIEKMGWKIASQEGSRFWITKNALEVLENKKGNDRIEGISLRMSEVDKDLCLEPTVFQDMCNLRVLNIYHPHDFLYFGKKYSKLNLGQVLSYLPNTLGYLRWDYCPLKIFPPNFRPEYLVHLEMPNSQLTHLWNGVQPLATLDLTECTSLKILPEISGNIGVLYLDGIGIKELPSSIRSCESLLYLHLSECKDLESIPELPRNLEELYLSETSIREMPAASIEFLHHVEVIDMKNCKRLESLPSNFCKLKALVKLHLSGCSNLKSFPEIMEPMKELSHVDLSKSGIQELPTLFENLIGLKSLNMEECINLKNIPEDLGKLGRLSSLTFLGCSKLESFPNMLLGLTSLTELNLNFCNIFEIPSWIGDLTSLFKLNLRGNMLASIPPSIKQLPKLVELDISDCANLRLLPDLPLSLGFLIADGCMSLRTVLKTSRSTFAQRHLGDYLTFLGYKLEFMFRGCLKLNQNACNKIAMDFLCRIAYIYSIKERMPSSESKLCYSGNRIPEWMRHRSEGFSKLTIKLPPNWRNSKFKGFIACVVLSFKELCMYVKDELDICCTVHIKTKDDQSHYNGTFRCSSGRSFFFVKEKQIEEIYRGSDHVFMWYGKFYGNYSDGVEMSIDFFCGRRSENSMFKYSSEFDYSSTYEVKRCGVHMLCYIKEELIGKNNTSIKQYMDDTEQQGITIRQHIQPLQDPSHNVIEEEPSDNDDRNIAGPSWDSTTDSEEDICLKYLTSSSFFDSDKDQTDNIVEDDSDAVNFDGDEVDKPPVRYTYARKRRKLE